MAVDQATYRVVRHETIEKVIRWALNRLNLRDWEVELEYGDLQPNWVDSNGSTSAQTRTLPAYFQADIWISPKACKESNYHPVSVAIHEVLHIFFHHYRIEDQDERMINTLESILFKHWQSEHRKK